LRAVAGQIEQLDLFCAFHGVAPIARLVLPLDPRPNGSALLSSNFIASPFWSGNTRQIFSSLTLASASVCMVAH
jgi:hypothetical protein